ncbi:MAG: hypothetical protein EON61_07040 [Alphaproteobacteria bacterium]|jgi:hypothetical protein|nr:MAG: hypothetical protein EON61_07040 [Alphaproteobacteria bacterium]
MSVSTDPTASPEWEQARIEWYGQTKGDLQRLQEAVNAATPGSLPLDAIYAPMHDMAGLAGVLGYPLLGNIARGMIETLRKGANPLDDRMLMVAKAHLAALVALHAKDVRGEGGPAGVAVLAKLASIHA